MEINIDVSGSLEGFKKLLVDAQNNNAKGVLIFACDNNNFTSDDLNPILKSLDIPVFGGIFPQILYKNTKYEKGTAVLIFQEYVPTVHTIKDISTADAHIANDIANITENEFQTLFVFVDAFATSIEQLIEELYMEFGLEYNFLGGGAGSLSFEKKPVIISNEGLLEDAAVVVTSQRACGIGVKHGWESIAGPFQMTKADKNIIYELDYRPAFEVYKEVVEAHANQTFTDENFFDIAKAYPFGISKVGSEKVVRDPISQENNALICVGNVKNGEYVDILNSSTEQLVQAAADAMKRAKESSPLQEDVSIFIDCISRVLFMGDDFQKELNTVTQDSDNLIGAMSLGEIANTGKNYLEFYNKTAVVGVF